MIKRYEVVTRIEAKSLDRDREAVVHVEAGMTRIPCIEIVRRAYRIWERSGKPDGKDWEFYYQAERELEDEQLKNHQTEGSRDRQD
jgi:hypothetical protein